MPTSGLADTPVLTETRATAGGFADRAVGRAPILVLGLGNLLLGDDGLGLELLAEMSKNAVLWGNQVAFVDGGTQGMMLLEEVSGRPAVLILDAVDRGAAPGTVHALRNSGVTECRVSRSTTAHEGNAGELLAAAALLGASPLEVAVVGVQPARIATGIGLSETVQESLRPALLQAQSILSEMIARYANVSSSPG
jgi:hydrogenase maturation protease